MDAQDQKQRDVEQAQDVSQIVRRAEALGHDPVRVARALNHWPAGGDRDASPLHPPAGR